jgi:hypothetical protein
MAARAPGPPTCFHSSTCSRREREEGAGSVQGVGGWRSAVVLQQGLAGHTAHHPPPPPLLTGQSTSSSLTVQQGVCPPTCFHTSICSAQPRRPPPARPQRKRAREQTDRGQCGECQCGGSEVPSTA